MAEVLPGPYRQERQVYEDHREQLLRLHDGYWVLIKGEKILGIFTGQWDAIRAGWGKLGDVPFWTGPITASDRVISTSAARVR
jgi:hypothetical protein